MATPKTAALLLQMTEDQKRRWREAASRDGLSLSEWIRVRCEGGIVVTKGNAPRKAG